MGLYSPAMYAMASIQPAVSLKKVDSDIKSFGLGVSAADRFWKWESALFDARGV